MSQEKQCMHASSGIAPIMLLILVILLVILGGGGYAVIKLASPECHGEGVVSCLNRSVTRAEREGKDREARRADTPRAPHETRETEQVMNETNALGELARHGTAVVRLGIRGDTGGTGDLRVAYDTRSVEGSFLLHGNISVTLNVSGTVDPETGVIDASATGDTTQTVDTGPLRGTVGQSYTGKFTGTLSDFDAGSGSIELTQRVTSVEGNLPTIREGQTTMIHLSWQGEPTN